MAIVADGESVLLHTLQHNLQLLLRAIFHQLLYEIVAEAIHHEIICLDHREIKNLIKHFLIFVFRDHLDLLLEESTAGLILCEDRGILVHFETLVPS